MSVFNLLDWRVITSVMPFIGIFSCFYLLISRKICTKRIAVSTSVALFLMLWLLLTWADWGSAVFVASYQIMWVRLILLVIAALIAFEIKSQRRAIAILRLKNVRVYNQNEALIINLHQLQHKINLLEKEDHHG